MLMHLLKIRQMTILLEKVIVCHDYEFSRSLSLVVVYHFELVKDSIEEVTNFQIYTLHNFIY